MTRPSRRSHGRSSPATFNWATDWFDVIARGNDRTALWIVEEGGGEQKISFAEMADRSDRVATWLAALGVGKGDRVILMLGNQVELWEAMLAVAKLGAVIMPTTGALGPADLADRITRGGARFVIANAADTAKFDDVAGDYTRIVGRRSGRRLAPLRRRLRRRAPPGRSPQRTTVDDSMLIYFTSGTTSKPKLVEHSQVSYPVGHLSTMAWIGVRPGDVHLAISSPGWAKHAWSCFFAPWIAEATIFVYNYSRFDAAALLDQLRRAGVNTFCAPPTVWRMLIQSDLGTETRRAARDPRRGRAAQSRRHRPSRTGVGADDPRRVRPDRDHAAGRQHTRPAGEAGLDGPADAGRAGRAGRPGHR